MNRYFLIALTSLTVCVAACTQKELLPADPFADKPWMVDPTIPVPIQLGNTDVFAVETKASDLEQVTSMDGVHFAVTAVPRSSLTSTPAEDFAAVDSEDKLPLKGVMAESTAGTIGFLTATGGTSVNYYYPQQGSNEERTNYSFYAYRTTTEDVDEPAAWNADAIRTYVDFTLEPQDHNVDVLYAYSGNAAPKVVDAVTYQGYNAEFIRKGGTAPSLAFYHKAACLKFVVVAETAGAETALAMEPGDQRDFKIKDLEIVGLYESVRLNLTGSTATPQSENLLTPLPESSPTDKNTPGDWKQVYKGNKTISPIVYNGGNGTVYGYVFIAPGKNGDFDTDPSVPQRACPVSIRFKTVAKDAANDDGVSTAVVDLPYPSYESSPANGAYLPGYCYTYKIKVKSPEKFVISSSVAAPFTDFTGDYLGSGDELSF